MERRAKAEAEEREKMQRRVDLEGCRLVVVRAADRIGFWYTENFEGFDGGEPLSWLAVASMVLTGFWKNGGFDRDFLLVYGIVCGLIVRSYCCHWRIV